MSELPPIELIEYAAAKLGDLCLEVTFLGGTVVSLLITDRGTRPPRPTNDVDVVIEIDGRLGYYTLDSRLLERGFMNDVRGPICRYLHGPIVIDVMPTDPDVLGFTNPWYALAIETARPYRLESGTTINLITPACFLATKLAAFDDPGREGSQDPFLSRDFADIVRLIDGHPTIADEVFSSPEPLRTFLRPRFARILKMRYLEEGIEEHVEEGRAELVTQRIEAFTDPSAPEHSP